VVVNSTQAAALAQSAGHDVIYFDDLVEGLNTADVIFNTVPKIILDEKNLPQVRKNAVIIDLASTPNGVDFSAARSLGIKTLFASSLPGKIAPKTTAKYIHATVERIIAEGGGENA
jgi:dipicolinate synthase subunit A